jgi:hypothetical protein|tara:strand:- start:3823 stop:4293 length:471 start_codon:yes stop_codon:yes gene_type:complete
MATPACVKKYAKSSGKSVSTLNKVYKRGQGAYFSSGSRPGQSSHSWGCGRVRSFATGKGGARKADADLLGKKKKRTKKSMGGGVMNSSQERKLKNSGKADLNRDGRLSSYEKARGLAIEKAMAKDSQTPVKKNRGGVIARACGAVMENKRKKTKML